MGSSFPVILARKKNPVYDVIVVSFQRRKKSKSHIPRIFGKMAYVYVQNPLNPVFRSPDAIKTSLTWLRRQMKGYWYQWKEETHTYQFSYPLVPKS